MARLAIMFDHPLTGVEMRGLRGSESTRVFLDDPVAATETVIDLARGEVTAWTAQQAIMPIAFIGEAVAPRQAFAVIIAPSDARTIARPGPA